MSPDGWRGSKAQGGRSQFGGTVSERTAGESVWQAEEGDRGYRHNSEKKKPKDRNLAGLAPL